MEWHRQPAVRLALLITLGIVAGRYSPFSPLITLVILAAGGVAFGVISVFIRDRREFYRTVLFGILLVAIGCVKFYLDATIFPSTHISNRCVRPLSGVISGCIAEQPKRQPGRISFVMHPSELLADSSRLPVSGDVLVTIFPSSDSLLASEGLRYGDRVVVGGEISLPPGPRNPGDFNYRNYLLLNGIYAVMTVDGYENIAVTGRDQGSWLYSSIVVPIRSYVRNVIDGTIGGAEGAFLKGLVIGERDDIPEEIQSSFIDAGVVHVLAVSGLNVAFVALIVIALSSFLPVHRILKNLLIIGTLILYMFVTGATPSIVRATLMVVVVMTGRMLQRRVPLLNAMAVSALVIYLFDTRQLFDIGFQLSYAAVISLIAVYPVLSGGIFPILEKSVPGRMFRPVANLFAASFAAQAGTLPLIIQYFGRVSVVSFLANVVVVPAANIALALGLILVFTSMISVWLAGLYGAVAQLLLSLTLRFITIAAHFRWSVFELHAFTPLHTVAYFISVVLVAVLWRGSALRKSVIVAVVGLNMLVLIWCTLPASPRDMKVTFFDVGQGDAALIEMPGGGAVLIDCGGPGINSDAGRKFIIPAMRKSGVDHLDALILTHSHSDHLGGAVSIIESVPVGSVYMNSPGADNELFSRIAEAARRENIPLRQLTEGMKIDFPGTVRIYVFHPPPEGISGSFAAVDGGGNNESIVLRVCYGRSSILFMGDAGRAIEERLCASYGSFLRSTILKVAHHGSLNASGEAFISMVRPAYAVISAGRNNSFGHPSPVVLDRYGSESVRLRRTDEAGAIVFRIMPDSLWEEEWR